MALRNGSLSLSMGEETAVERFVVEAEKVKGSRNSVISLNEHIINTNSQSFLLSTFLCFSQSRKGCIEAFLPAEMVEHDLGYDDESENSNDQAGNLPTFQTDLSL